MGTGQRAKTSPNLNYLVALMLVAAFFVWLWHPTFERCSIDSYDVVTTSAIDLKNCKLSELPSSISRFVSLKKLDLGNNVLHSLPDALPPSLETLFCLNNAFETIPPVIATLPRLRMLSFKSCRLRDLGVAPLPESLAWLILTDNELVALPDSLGRLTGMRKLMLANNKLGSLPSSMGAMRELELLRLSNNRLPAPPPWLYELPKLTWLAIAGNPFVAPAPARASLPDVRFDELTLGPKLGEGTSSIVRQGLWHGEMVAIKLYKAALSSDGMNLDEVRASCAVDHPHVLRWLGYLSEGEGEKARAVASVSTAWRLVGVLEWAPGFSSLGKPPSMESITRDTYKPSTSFASAEIREIGAGLAAALEHLHGRGLSHGDVYAHNVLWKRASSEAGPSRLHHRRRHHHHHREGAAAGAAAGGGDTEGGGAAAEDDGRAMAKLSDFGAAFYYGPGSAHAASYERMEQRAFGLLLAELLERHDGSEPELLEPVRLASRLAMAAAPEDRPGFARLARQLELEDSLDEESQRGPPLGRAARRGLRPRSSFGRVLPRGHPHYEDREG